MSASQEKLWQAIRHHKTGFHFKREVPFDAYTLDFYCHEAKLCVEVDGDQHDFHRDATRDEYLAQHGIQTLRFASRECLFNTESVVSDITVECVERAGREPVPPPP